MENNQSSQVQTEPVEQTTAELIQQALASTEASASTPEATAPAEDVTADSSDKTLPQQEEYVYVTDDSGVRKKVKVDFSPEKVKKAYEMAAGMRKFQAERDKLRKELESLSSLKSEYEDLKQSWEIIESTLKSKGLAGLVDTLYGKEGYYNELIERELAKREFLKNATPAERERYELQEKLAKAEREKQQKEKEFNDYRESLLRERQTQEELQLKNMINPAFNKYRFAGTLGDPVLEERLDQAIWNQTLTSLENLPDNVELTPAIIEREFKSVASAFKKAINRQAVQKAKEVIDTRKANAQSAVAAKATAAMSKSVEQAIGDLMDKEGTKGVLAKLFGVK